MSGAVTLSGYAVIATAFVVVQLAALTGGPPTLGAVLRWLMRRRGVRWLLVAGWLWLGWHLFVRAEHG